MKKILLTVITVLSLTIVNAQENKTKFGVKAGLNLSTLSGDTSGANKRTYFHAGVSLEIPISDMFSFQPEIIYSGQGYNSSQNVTPYGIVENITYKLNYLNIPLIFKCYPIEGFSFQMGPQIGVLLSGKAIGEVNNYNYYYDDYYYNSYDSPYYNPYYYMNNEVDEKITNRLHTLDLGLNFGLGYEFDMGLFFEGRYNLGLTNAYKNSKDYSNTNSVFQISLGYRFN